MVRYSKTAAPSLREVKERVTDLADKVDALSEKLSEMAAREAAADQRRREMSQDISEIKDEVRSLLIMSNRWKGGFIALAALGGIVGWVLTSWESIVSIFRMR